MTAVFRIGLAIAVFLVGACDRDLRLPEYELTGATMGTSFSIKLVAPPESLSQEALQQQVSDTLERIENLASTYRSHSEISLFNANQSTDWIDVSAEFCGVIERALAISRRTDGAFDITVGPLVNLWGFGPDEMVEQPPTQEEVSAALSRVGYERLQADCPARAVRKDQNDLYVDLSGWVKGYAVDELAALLDDNALSNYLVEIGGEMRVRGHNADNLDWAVAIEKPVASMRAAQTVLRLTDRGVATSGDYRNYFEHEGRRYSHTIDARSGWPVSHALAAVTVIDQSAAFADGMATAFLVLGPEAGPALAEKLGIAGYFLVRGQTGIEELTTSLFDAMKIQ
jgi:thiamine biosynthesis lipoprotein